VASPLTDRDGLSRGALLQITARRRLHLTRERGDPGGGPTTWTPARREPAATQPLSPSFRSLTRSSKWSRLTLRYPRRARDGSSAALLKRTARSPASSLIHQLTKQSAPSISTSYIFGDRFSLRDQSHRYPTTRWLIGELARSSKRGGQPRLDTDVHDITRTSHAPGFRDPAIRAPERDGFASGRASPNATYLPHSRRLSRAASKTSGRRCPNRGHAEPAS